MEFGKKLGWRTKLSINRVSKRTRKERYAVWYKIENDRSPRHIMSHKGRLWANNFLAGFFFFLPLWPFSRSPKSHAYTVPFSTETELYHAVKRERIITIPTVLLYLYKTKKKKRGGRKKEWNDAP